MAEGLRGKYDWAIYNSPQHKMGIKIMNEEQMTNIFPQYKNLWDNIKIYRKEAEAFREGLGTVKDRQYNFMFDNIFSIMGPRGSGKTSVLYTLKEMISQSNPHDVILPIVMPELIPDSSDIIGWILALIEETVRGISQKLQERGERSSAGGLFKGCRADNWMELQNKYQKIKELCNSSSYDMKNANTISEAQSYLDRKTQNSFDLSQELAEFWSMLKNKILETSDEAQVPEPLIYVMFDDVDMVPDRLWELLSVIVKYLSHPNVIVILTADEEMLYQVVKNTLWDKINDHDVGQKIVLFQDSEEINEEKYKTEQARLYIAKILPPSTRYYIETFETCDQKKNFIIKLEFDDKHHFKRRIRLENFLENLVQDYQNFIINEMERSGKVEKAKKIRDFMHFESGDKTHFVDAYLMFLGNTARQVGNGCLILEELFANLKELPEVDTESSGERYLQGLHQAVRQFAFKLLNTNSNMRRAYADIGSLVDELIVYEPKDWGIFLNYGYIYEQTEDQGMFGSENIARMNRRMRSSYRNYVGIDEFVLFVKDNLTLYVILFFIENLLVWEGIRREKAYTRNRDCVHGQISLVTFLDRITADDMSLVRRKSVQREENMACFLYSYGKLLEKPEILMTFKLTNAVRVREYFFALNSEEDIEKELQEYHQRSPVWFRSMVQLQYLSREGFYDIPRRLLSVRELDPAFRIYDQGWSKIAADSLDDIQRELQYAGKRTDQEIEEMLYNQEDIKGLVESLTEEEESTQINTIEDMTREIDIKILEKTDDLQKNSEERKKSILKISYYLSMIQDIDPKSAEKIKKEIRQGFPKGIYDPLLPYLQEEMVMQEKCFVRYHIRDYNIFVECIKEAQEIGKITFDLRRVEGKSYIDMGYLNAVLRTILREAFSKEIDDISEGDPATKEGGILRRMYRKITRQLDVDIAGKRKEALTMILYRKLYASIQLEELNSFRVKYRTEGTFSSIANAQLPYNRLYEKIQQEVFNGKPKNMITYLIENYIQIAIGSYLESITFGGMNE